MWIAYHILACLALCGIALDFPHEVTQRYESMCREDPEYAEMILYYLVECGTDRFNEFSEDDFRELIQARYDNLMEGVY